MLATICCTDVTRKTWLWQSSATGKQIHLPAKCLWFPVHKPTVPPTVHPAHTSSHSSLSRWGTHKTRGVVIPYGFGIAKSFHGWVSLDDLILEGALENKTKGCVSSHTARGDLSPGARSSAGAPCCTRGSLLHSSAVHGTCCSRGISMCPGHAAQFISTAGVCSSASVAFSSPKLEPQAAAPSAHSSPYPFLRSYTMQTKSKFMLSQQAESLQAL